MVLAVDHSIINVLSVIKDMSLPISQPSCINVCCVLSDLLINGLTIGFMP